MARAGDPAILERATRLRRVLFSQDDDLLVIACAWQRAGHEFSGVIYGRQLGITIGRAIDEIELLLTILSPDEMRNQVQYLPL